MLQELEKKCCIDARCITSWRRFLFGCTFLKMSSFVSFSHHRICCLMQYPRVFMLVCGRFIMRPRSTRSHTTSTWCVRTAVEVCTNRAKLVRKELRLLLPRRSVVLLISLKVKWSKVILYYTNDKRTCLQLASCHAGQHNKYRHAGQV